MKIIFMGTPDFAIPSLKALIESRHSVVAAVTTPDKERGRGQKVTFTPVKEFALKNNIEVLQPVSLKDESFISRLKELQADLFVIVAFRILPKEVYSIPPRGAFNLHGSLLPKYRGAAPIQWAIIKGEKETGLTTFFLQDKVDTGNVILREKVEILEGDDFGSLHDKMSPIGAELVLRTIELIEKGNVPVEKQDDATATPAPKITKETAQIDWNKPAVQIHDLIRGLSPHPGAFFTHNGKVIKIYRSTINCQRKLSPGEIFRTKTEATIGCGTDALDLLEVQIEGRRRMGIEEFLRGYKF
ncbi:MAG: methionyl-tRNA formyltransferase [Ignavibacteria bacterium]|jgi:methionyl-tRNA formyltransferase|nr:methionyl-tRNA formyltransferase [Ignavibacteria bacterium]MCU7502457.1 methionyl-tRNA formyltransferase [Ignavibacteria bacterium]MCU7514978.1 methionyl-tRNA formyltransferase [Ignavibacteria bacterium]